MQSILVTGGAGFIGSNFVRHVIQNRAYQVINLDVLSYSGNPENLTDLQDEPRHRFVPGDINDGALLDQLLPGCDAVVHFAAESHVDRSIIDCSPFIKANVLGTQSLLDAARRHQVGRFVHVSTDEVYGSLPLEPRDAKFTEDNPIQPNSPYAASKAASDLLVLAYHETYGMDVCVTRCSNNYGPYQFPEKLIPLFVTNLIDGRKVPLYGDGQNVRDWIHVLDHCEAVLSVLEKGAAGRTYNVGGDNEWSNLDLTRLVLEIMGAGEDQIEYVKDRPGHDRRYAIDAGRIQSELGWQPQHTDFRAAVEQTIQWYRDHEQWWRRVKSGVYRDVVDRLYSTSTNG